MNTTSNILASFATARDELLVKIVEVLTADRRFIAAWLTGSFGRGTADTISDLDLNVVVADEAAEMLCATPWRSGGQTTPQRYNLMSRFGEPIIIFEAHDNAPTAGSSFTTAVYETGLIVDWILIPQAEAKRPVHSQLLFEKQSIPLQPPPEPESLAERAQKASHQVCFFWMMAAVLVKWIVRGDVLEFNTWLNTLIWILEDVERLIAGRPWEYRPSPIAALKLTTTEQKTAVQQLCQQMLILMPQVAELGGYVPTNPMKAINGRLSLIDTIDKNENPRNDTELH